MLCTDTRLGGYGAVVGTVTQDQSREWGLTRERRRFKFKSAGARKHALRQDPWAGAVDDPDPELDEWEVDVGLPEVDPSILLGIE